MKTITCPKCHEKIELNNEIIAELLKDTDNQKIQEEIQKRVDSRTKEIEAKYQAEAKLKSMQDMEAKQKEISSLQTQIKVLETKIENHQNETKLAVSDAVSSYKEELNKKDQELIMLKDEVSDVKKEAEIQQNYLKSEHAKELESKDKEIARFREYRYGDSTKDLGESLEKYCEDCFEEMRAIAFPNAQFYKDTTNVKEEDEVKGSKGDYIFKELDNEGNEIVSILFDMKTEKENTATKKTNESHLDKLDRDRTKKNCEYAVLVSTLEADSKVYNKGIVDVSHKYPKMFVVRPEFFMSIIGLIRSFALKSFEYKKEIIQYKQSNVDVENFEAELDEFKTAFGKQFKWASDRYNDAIKQLDTAIENLQKMRESLTSSQKHLTQANDKVEDISIRKLTYSNKTMKEKFEKAKNSD